MPSPSEAITTYMLGKDGNRPWLMRQVFTEDASVEIVVNTDAISFPSAVTGVDAITDVLVRQFSCDNENVYTFCLTAPPEVHTGQFSCDWLVGMARRNTGEIRVGCGRYDWSFGSQNKVLANGLKITIQAMEVVAPEHLQSIMSWLSELPYPWCPAKTAVLGVPSLNDLRSILDYLRQCK